MILIAISHGRKSSVIAIRELLYTNLDSDSIIPKNIKIAYGNKKKRGLLSQTPQEFKDQEIKRLKTSKFEHQFCGTKPDTEP